MPSPRLSGPRVLGFQSMRHDSQAHYCAIQKLGQGAFNPVHQAQHRLHLWHREYDRHTLALWRTANGIHPFEGLSMGGAWSRCVRANR